MKMYLSTFGTFAFIFAAFFDQQLNITGRLNDGSLLHDVRRVHTVTINGVKYTSEPSVDANMRELRHLSVCSITPENCQSKDKTWEI